ncbi:MAG: hypothetical protein WKF77_18995, partial [Planctomycetaceae bacterium]
RQLAGTKTRYRRAHAAPLTGLISDGVEHSSLNSPSKCVRIGGLFFLMPALSAVEGYVFLMPYRLLILFTTVIGAALLLAPWPLLGVAGEWVWPRHALPTDLVEALDRLIWPLICGSVVVVFCATCIRRIDNCGSMQRGLLLLGLTALSFLWLNAVRQAAPSPHRELRPIWILYHKYASGYFFEATFNVTSTRQMLVDYESRMAKGDVLHEGTHPPGLLLLNRGLLRLTESSSAMVRFSEALQNRETFRLFRDVEVAGRIARPLSKSEFAALHLSSLLSTLFAAMTVIPVFGLTRRLTDSQTAWRAAALMLTVPTIGIFVPRSDVLYACSGMMLAWTAVAAMLTERRSMRWLLGSLSGLALWLSAAVSGTCAGRGDAGRVRGGLRTARPKTPNGSDPGNDSGGCCIIFDRVWNLATRDALQPPQRVAYEPHKSRGILFTISSHMVDMVCRQSGRTRHGCRSANGCNGYRHARANNEEHSLFGLEESDKRAIVRYRMCVDMDVALAVREKHG